VFLVFWSVWVAQRPDCAVGSKPATLSALMPENILAGIMPNEILRIYEE
jgi:hypothetical protein